MLRRGAALYVASPRLTLLFSSGKFCLEGVFPDSKSDEMSDILGILHAFWYDFKIEIFD